MEEDGTYTFRELIRDEESTLKTEEGVLLIDTTLSGRDARLRGEGCNDLFVYAPSIHSQIYADESLSFAEQYESSDE